MKKLLLASVFAVALAPFAYAQQTDFSLSTAGTASNAHQTAAAETMGAGAVLAGGVTTSQTTANDLSFAASSPAGTLTGTTGGTNSAVANVDFSAGTGNSAGASMGSGNGAGFNFGLGAAFHHTP